MKHLFHFLLGVMFVALISATTVSIMTVRPATPKSVLVFGADSQNSCVNSIKEYVKQGYIVKSVAGTSQYGMSWIVVMEKY
jgi:hypothetical protein